MKFLLVDRPKKYADRYTSLPSDSWLMMAVNEMWDIPELRDGSYRDFVFSDANLMVSLMYKSDNAPLPGFIRVRFITNLEIPRILTGPCEGLMAALELAVKTGDQGKTTTYREALKQAAWATLHLCNTPESVYSVPPPGQIDWRHPI